MIRATNAQLSKQNVNLKRDSGAAENIVFKMVKEK